MGNESTDRELLSRASTATAKRTTVRLDKIKFDLDRFCHRDLNALKPENLTSLMESLVLEGLQVPIEVYTDELGNIILLKGHCRVTSCRILAGKNEPRFTPDMEIDAIEVQSASPVDYLVRSISDNEVRLNLDRVSRIRVAKKLYDASVQVDRAARAMGLQPKTYERALLIAKHAWMFQHVIDQSIAPTHASELLDEAVKAERLNEMREDLDAWIAGKKQMIRGKERARKAQGGKDLSPADKQVKKYLPIHLVRHWVELLRANQRFDDDAKWNFAAGIEPETEQLKISSVNLDLTKATVDQIAKVASKLRLLTKKLEPYLKKAHDKKTGEGEPEAVEMPYDLDYLRDLGLEDVAQDLEAQTELAGAPDGEDEPQEPPPERSETDLTHDVQLPPEPPPERSETDLTHDVQLPSEPAVPPPAAEPPPAPPATPPAAKKPANGKEGRKK